MSILWIYYRVKAIKDEYDESVAFIHSKNFTNVVDFETKGAMYSILRDNFKNAIEQECNNIEIGCNIMIDICYSDKNSKDLLWDMFGEQIIKNLIANGYNKLRFPIKDEEGDITFKGIKFRMEEVDANGINWK